MKIVGDATAGVFVTNAVHLGRQVTRQPPPGVLEVRIEEGFADPRDCRPP